MVSVNGKSAAGGCKPCHQNYPVPRHFPGGRQPALSPLDMFSSSSVSSICCPASLLALDSMPASHYPDPRSTSNLPSFIRYVSGVFVLEDYHRLSLGLSASLDPPRSCLVLNALVPGIYQTWQGTWPEVRMTRGRETTLGHDVSQGPWIVAPNTLCSRCVLGLSLVPILFNKAAIMFAYRAMPHSGRRPVQLPSSSTLPACLAPKSVAKLCTDSGVYAGS